MSNQQTSRPRVQYAWLEVDIPSNIQIDLEAETVEHKVDMRDLGNIHNTHQKTSNRATRSPSCEVECKPSSQC
ncbi:hypothetical protein PGT21_000101 [Puccinia graminis f. sp. tritici]|uniref:Uncharacterized protein n=2 Tax=Puccinia graminis f. sp. tritici TaxID=56615 RepID=H6QVP0_PUCGT|nr:uncharacterized protein PGTG_22811 [Puccinia graminis f. sp. tritici CRL 75-36-700-3]EHS63643.1 hypothetical protein PGTG_22811 [Puccinia graminis f. sp. tritici CRL 75-36-700-3]KAA1064378.1 hypothetical protein PGT21_000101 [Puccinia graminis f. sp. tritici]